MGWLWLPSVPHDPAGYPTGIEFDPTGILDHTTQGSWPGDYAVLTRSLVPSVQFLVGEDEGDWAQFYPINMVCYGAAGANMRKIHVEASGFTGNPRNAWQRHAIGIIMRESAAAVSRDFLSCYYDGPRIWIDQDDPVGSLPHAQVAYPPDRSYEHYDRWEPGEHELMYAGEIPSPSPDPNVGDDEMAGPKTITWTTPTGAATDKIIVVGGSVFTYYPKGAGVWGRFPIAGPAAAAGRYQLPISDSTAIEVGETKGLLIFNVTTQDGHVVQCSWAPANPPPSTADGSLWRSDLLPIA